MVVAFEAVGSTSETHASRMKVRIARDAKADLDEIWLYIAERPSVEAAQRLLIA